MSRPDVETHLRTDAEQITAPCPDTPRHNVLRRMRAEESGTGTGHRRWMPAVATAFSLAAVIAILLLVIPEQTGEQAEPVPAATRLQVAAVDPDRMLAREEAALRAEWQNLEADFIMLGRQLAISASDDDTG